jgi:hypothetical protein
MKISEAAIRYNECEAYLKMLEGIEMLMLKTPKSEKKEMLYDIIKHGKKLTKSHQTHLNSIQWLQLENTKLDGMLESQKTYNKKLEIDKKKLEKQIKEMLNE